MAPNNPRHCQETRFREREQARQRQDIRETKRNIPTMGDAFDQFIADHTPEWKRRGERRAQGLEYKWKLSKRYCKSILSKKISAVTHDDVKDLLRPDWHERAPTAARVQNHLSNFLTKPFRWRSAPATQQIDDISSEPLANSQKVNIIEKLHTRI